MIVNTKNIDFGLVSVSELTNATSSNYKGNCLYQCRLQRLARVQAIYKSRQWSSIRIYTVLYVEEDFTFFAFLVLSIFISRAVARALIGGLNIHIFVLCPTNFF